MLADELADMRIDFIADPAKYCEPLRFRPHNGHRIILNPIKHPDCAPGNIGHFYLALSQTVITNWNRCPKNSFESFE
jgi:hypothetical protein